MRKVIAGVMVLTSFMGAGQVAVASPKKNDVYRTPRLGQYNEYKSIELDEAVGDFVRSSKAKKNSYMVASNSPILETEKEKKILSDCVRTPSLLDDENQRKEREQQEQLSLDFVEGDWEFLPSNRKMYDSSNDRWLDPNLSFEEITNPNVIVMDNANFRSKNKKQDFNVDTEEIKQYNILISESTSDKVFRAGSDTMSKYF